jgi:hypothetical protein
MSADSTNHPGGCGCSSTPPAPGRPTPRPGGADPRPDRPGVQWTPPSMPDSFESLPPTAPRPTPPDSSVPLPGDPPGDGRTGDPCWEPPTSNDDPCSRQDPAEAPPSSIPIPQHPGSSSSARVSSVISRRPFDFTNLGASATLEFVMVRAADVVAWGDATLLLRAHALTIPVGAKLELIAKAIAPSADAPAIDFLALDPVASVTLDSTVSAPALRSGPLAAGWGSHVQIVLRATQASSPSTFTADISADLVLRDRAAEPTLLREYTTHNYDDTTSLPLFIPFGGTTAGSTLSDANNQLRMIAPYDGWLHSVTVYTTVSGGAGVTVVAFHKDDSASSSATRTATLPQKTSVRFDFGPAVSFTRGQRLSIMVDPTAGPADANVVCEWVFRRSS